MLQDEITIADGVIKGPLRQSVNNSRTAAGSIHDDATATKLGFRGGTVAGSIHMELFPPLLLRAFGQKWFERGSLSLYFVNATTDRESVRAHLSEPKLGGADEQVDAWIDREDGMPVAEGTASLGRPEPSALDRRDISKFAQGEFRILAHVKPGDQLGPVTVKVSADAQEARKKVITEPLDWYWDASPWGGPIAVPTLMVQALYAQPIRSLKANTSGAVGLFGAIELQNVNGPVLVDREYTAVGSVAAIGQSPKTEYVWFDTGLDDGDGKMVAGMRMLLRWMKASSPLYQE
jgi:hypothetical protein